MDKDSYLEERLNNQIKWYDTKSTYHQHRFKILKYTEVSMGFLIPLISIAKPINFEFFLLLAQELCYFAKVLYQSQNTTTIGLTTAEQQNL